MIVYEKLNNLTLRLNEASTNSMASANEGEHPERDATWFAKGCYFRACVKMHGLSLWNDLEVTADLLLG